MTRQLKKVNKIWNISTTMPVSYSMIEYPNIFSSDDPLLFGNIIVSATIESRRFVVIDKEVEKIYGAKIYAYFRKYKVAIEVISIESSEKNKSLETLLILLKRLDEYKLLRRSEPIIAIGGGVLLDIVGLAANLYRRGVPYIRIPTTLIGLIDAGIGVKTGINFCQHKNRIGTYYPPLITYIDPTFLSTLDSRHISNGLAEILKIGIIKDVFLFELLEKNGEKVLMNKLQDHQISRTILDKAISNMLVELESNLWENSLERLVDFGHTFSGALEMKSSTPLLHGEAVNIDMALVCILAYNRKLITDNELSRIFSVMTSIKLPIFHILCDSQILYDALQDTTYHRDGLQRFPIPTGIGQAKFIDDISYREIDFATSTLKRISRDFVW